MSKYYYVNIVNRDANDYDNYGFETEKAIRRNTCSLALESGGFCAGLPGIKLQKTDSNIRSFAPLPIIVEDVGYNDFFVEVITGRRYKIVKSSNKNLLKPQLLLSIVGEISTENLAEMLHTLSKADIVRYVGALDRLEEAIASAYHNDSFNKSEHKKRVAKDEEYIKSFQKKHNEKHNN